MRLIYDFDLDDFEYEVEDKDLQKALAIIILDRIYSDKANLPLITSIINELDIIYNDEIMSNFEDEIKAHFYEDAYIRYQEECQDSADEKTWFGTKNDVGGI